MKKVINIEARRPMNVWEVRRNAFRYEFEQVSRSCNAVNMKFLCNVELLKPLLKIELQLVADTPERIPEDVAGHKMLEEGVCEWSKSNGESGQLRKLQFFGKRALRQGKEAKRVATVTAVSGRAVRQVRAAGGGVHRQS